MWARSGHQHRRISQAIHSLTRCTPLRPPRPITITHRILDRDASSSSSSSSAGRHVGSDSELLDSLLALSMPRGQPAAIPAAPLDDEHVDTFYAAIMQPPPPPPPDRPFLQSLRLKPRSLRAASIAGPHEARDTTRRSPASPLSMATSDRSLSDAPETPASGADVEVTLYQQLKDRVRDATVKADLDAVKSTLQEAIEHVVDASLLLDEAFIQAARGHQRSFLTELQQLGTALALPESVASQQADIHLLLHQPGESSVLCYKSALQYLAHLESYPTATSRAPSPTLYLSLFAFLSHRGFRRSYSIDLFDRMRLVAHPEPPISTYIAVLEACARGGTSDAERAMDYFTELSELKCTNTGTTITPPVEAYAHVVRAVIRGRRSAVGRGRRRDAEHAWSMALGLLGQCIGHGLNPSAGIWTALLEGAKRVGDLARAKWIYGLLLRQKASKVTIAESVRVGGVNITALGYLLQCYASYKIPSREPPATSPATDGIIYNPNDERPLHTSTSQKLPSVFDFVGDQFECSFFATIPHTRSQVLFEIKQLMEPHLQHLKEYPQQYTRRQVERRKIAVLHASYLSAVSAHGTLPYLHSQYLDVTCNPTALTSSNVSTSTPSKVADVVDGGKAWRTTWTYVLMMESCEKSRDPKQAGQVARQIWTEFRQTESWQKNFEQVKSIHGKLISQLWASWIRVQALFGGVEEAFESLKEFERLYPIETSTVDSPYLLFWHVQLLHHRLKHFGMDDHVLELGEIVTRYERAWKNVNDKEKVEREKDRLQLITQRTHVGSPDQSNKIPDQLTS